MLKKMVLGLVICLSTQLTAWAVDMVPFIDLLTMDGAKWVYEDENGAEAVAEIMPFDEASSDTRQLKLTSFDSTGALLNVIDEYYEINSGEVFEVSTEKYEVDSTEPSERVQYDAPYKKIIIADMDVNDPLISTGNGQFELSSFQITIPITFTSNVEVLGYEWLTMPYGTFYALEMTTVQTYSGSLSGINVSFEETFTVYVEPNLGVLALEDQNGRTELTGIKNVLVPGDANGDADVDGSDLAEAVSPAENIDFLAQYFGVAMPVIE